MMEMSTLGIGKKFLITIILSSVFFITGTSFSATTGQRIGDFSQVYSPQSVDVELDENSGNTKIRLNVLVDQSEEEIELYVQKLKKDPNATVLFTSDSPKLIAEELELTSRNTKNFYVMPLDPAALESRFGSLLKYSQNHIVNSISSDALGAVVVTYVTAMDVFYWVYAGNLSSFQVGGNIALTLMSALVFGIDKDAWSRVISPMKYRVREFMDRISISSSSKIKNELISAGIASTALSTIINLARVPFLPLDSFVDGVLGSSPITYSLILAIVSTAASFTWSELVASIKQTHFPNTKFIVRRTMELRSALLGTFAANAMLMNTSVYGWGPWLTLSVVSGVGMVLYTTSEKWINWIEKNVYLPKVLTERLHINNNLKNNLKSGNMLCTKLFSRVKF